MPSRLPRRLTLTTDGTASAASAGPRFSRCTGSSRSVRSTGAWTISTVTLAERVLLRRSVGSIKPTVTVSVTGPLAPATDTGSVSASVARSTALSGPTTSTLTGSAVQLPTA